MTIRMPLVSVGIPVYNGEKFLPRALNALLKQTYDQLELVISDNASTDSTQEICRQYAVKDARIRYYRNPTNIGVYANFRRVVELSSGEYFLWASVDDVRPVGAIENCVRALFQNSSAVMAHGPVLIEAEGRKDIIEISNAVPDTAGDAAARIRSFTMSITHNAILYGLYRRSALIQGRLGSCYGQDYLLCLQMCLLGSLAYIETPMMICRERKPLPNDNPMYMPVPLTMRNLLRAGGLPRRKCWVVLFMGCYYLSRISSISFKQRLSSIVAHLAAFCKRHHALLVREILFQLFAPVASLSTFLWPLVRQWPLSLRLARRLQAR